ncbi:cysteine protease StiP family protein [Rhizobium laguerreae]|nr:cysteine protease StiP family protein [Rhizobium laguerreae]
MDTLNQEVTTTLGSYLPDDVTFLLKRVEMQTTDVAAKEEAIQSGRLHYSEMISTEKAPTSEYMQLFAKAMETGAERMGVESARLAHAIAASVEGPVTLVSLVRAGVPLGVVLKRAIKALGRDVEHYGVSIIRDKGIDDQAMRKILSTRPVEGVVFVDGWTGKGAITGQLEASFKAYSDKAPEFVVLADPCGRASLAASGDDWLIPSGILGCTVSGLISRSILNRDVVGPGDYHACVQWDHLADHDISRSFVDEVWSHTRQALATEIPSVWNEETRRRHRDAADAAVAWVVEENGVTNINRVKPGIAEATRAILRRMPEKVYVSSPADPELAALMHLIEDRGVPYVVAPEKIAPYRAVTLIQKVS